MRGAGSVHHADDFAPGSVFVGANGQLQVGILSSLVAEAIIQLIRGYRQPSGPMRSMPCASMLTINGGLSFAPDLRAWVDSGRVRCRAGGCLNVVVTSRKITSTISTSIRATMITAGAECFLRMKKAHCGYGQIPFSPARSGIDDERNRRTTFPSRRRAPRSFC
jgi:hypothetical protein